MNVAVVTAAWLRFQSDTAATPQSSEPYPQVVVRAPHVNGVDEPDHVRRALHDNRARADAVPEEPHALHQRAVRYAGGYESHRLARREIRGRVDPLDVGDAHRAASFFVLGLRHDEARVDLAAQAAHRGGGEDALGRAADPHHGVDA